MRAIGFYVQGSKEDPYEVFFYKKNDGELLATCNCKAGAMGQWCKHRINIIQGDSSAVVSDNIGEVETVARWAEGTMVTECLARIAEQERVVKAYKGEYDRERRKLLELKQDLAWQMTGRGEVG